MKRALPILMFAAALLWLAPAVRALPLEPGQARALPARLDSSPQAIGLAAPMPDPAATGPHAAPAVARQPRASRAGVPQLLYVGLLGLLILGTDRRIERKGRDLREAASTLPQAPA